MKAIYGKKSSRQEDKIYVNEFDFKSPPADSESIKLAISELNRMCGTQLGGKKVSELFMYRDIPMWWFCYERLTGYFISTISFVHNFLRFVEEHGPDEVRVEGDFANFLLIREVCRTKNIRFSFSTTGLARFNMASRLRRTTKKRVVRQLTKRKAGSRRSLYGNRPLPELEDKILFASYATYRRQIYDPLARKSGVGEFLVDDIVGMLGALDCSVGIDFMTRLRSGDAALKARIDDGSFAWFPADVLVSGGSDHAKFLAYFEDTISSESFLSLFVFGGVPFGKHLLPFLREFLLECYLPYWMDLVDSLERHLAENRPRAAFMLFETSPPSLALISACRRLGIKTVGMQHGIIHDSHQLYMHDDVYSAQNPRGFIVPDCLLVFGDTTRKYLLKCNYPAGSLVAFCNPQFLNVQAVKNARDEILSSYGLPTDRKIILFAPPGMKDFEKSDRNYNLEILEALLERLTVEFFLVIKPHPADPAMSYARVLDEHHGRAHARIVDGSITELIAVSDALVSTFSTTIIDAMCLDVPTIQVRVEGIHYERPYDGFDAVLQTTVEDLFPSVQRLISDKNLQERLASNGREFVKRYYNIPIDDPGSILEGVIPGGKERRRERDTT